MRLRASHPRGLQSLLRGQTQRRSARHAPTRPHTPQLRPVPSTTTNCLRPPAVPDTVSRHPGRRSDSRRPPTLHERTLYTVTGRAHTVIRPRVYAGPRNRAFCIWQPCARDSGNKTTASAHVMGSGGLADGDRMSVRRTPWWTNSRTYPFLLGLFRRVQ